MLTGNRKATEDHIRSVLLTSLGHIRSISLTSQGHIRSMSLTSEGHIRSMPLTSDGYIRSVPLTSKGHIRSVPVTSKCHITSMPNLIGYVAIVSHWCHRHPHPFVHVHLRGKEYLNHSWLTQEWQLTFGFGTTQGWTEAKLIISIANNEGVL